MRKLNILLALLFIPLFSSHATTLEEAMVEAYNTNPTLLSGREGLKAVDENIYQAISGFLPNINFTNQRGSTDANIKTRDKPVTYYPEQKYMSGSNQIALNQNLFNGGANIIGLKIAKTMITMERASLTATEQAVLATVAQVYSNVLLTEETLSLRKQAVDVLTKHLESVATQYELGEVTKTDVARTKASLSQAIAERVKAEGDYLNSKANYKKTVGSDPVNLESYNNKVFVFPQTLEEAVKLANDNYPHVVAAKLGLELENGKLLQYAANLLPRVDVNAAIQRSLSPLNISQGNNAKHKSVSKTASLTVTVPIYHGGLEYSKIRAQKNSVQKTKYSLQDKLNEVTQQTIEAWQNYETASISISAYEDVVEAAQVAFESALKEAEVGARTNLEVLDAEQVLFKAKVELATAKVNKFMASNKLLMMLGKFNAMDLSLPTKIYDTTAHYDSVKLQLIGF